MLTPDPKTDVSKSIGIAKPLSTSAHKSAHDWIYCVSEQRVFLRLGLRVDPDFLEAVLLLSH